MTPESHTTSTIEKHGEGGKTTTKKKTKKRKAVRAASKTTAMYWQKAAFRLQKGEWESSNFFVRITLQDKRKRVRLESTTREEAGREALAQYLKILTNGWPVDDETKLSLPETSGLSNDPTVSEWISMAKKKSGVRSGSVDKYAESLRTIVSEILGMRCARKKEQRSKIDDYKVSDITKEKLKAWLEDRMARARELDNVRTLRAQNTIRSLVANAKGLFTEHILEAIGLPEESITHLPFRSLKLPAKNQTRYSSRFDAKTLLKTAAAELGTAAPGVDQVEADNRYEQWKILYLALVAGLRYNEIDQLRVQDISPADGRISIRTHETFRPKTHASEGDILVSPEAAAVLREMLKRTKDSWFIKDGTSKRSRSYRAGTHHTALVAWLRNYEERGVCPLADVSKPIHELRKEAGTLVNSQHGLNEAKNFLRHSSIATTAAYYVGSKGNITTGLS
jgi:integrase